MHIVFLSERYGHASCEVRTLVPAMWINKYTDHTASAFDKLTWAQHGFWETVKNADVIIVHTPFMQFAEQLEAIKKRAPEKILLFDMDDWYFDQFEQFHNGGWLLNRNEAVNRLVEVCDGITIAGKGLYKRWKDMTDTPIAYIDNGFDLSLPYNNFEKVPYAHCATKVVWGGGGSHGRELEMFIKFGVLEGLYEHLEFDMFFHPLATGLVGERPFRGGMVQSGPPKSVDRYIYELYRDASFSVAPLVTDTLEYNTGTIIPDQLNHCRSGLKLIEAGVARMPCVASNTDSYMAYEGGVTIVENKPQEWFNAMATYIQDVDKREADGAENRSIVEQYYDAPLLTQKRIDFINELRS